MIRPAQTIILDHLDLLRMIYYLKLSLIFICLHIIYKYQVDMLTYDP